jgi:radical SAM superfamily enzyme
MEKDDIVEAAKPAIENCHRHGIMIIGGLTFGLPEDDEDAIRKTMSFSVSWKRMHPTAGY